MGYKLDLLQPKQDVFWHLTYSRSETNNAWIIPLEVMKFVYLGLNITCTKFWISCICTRPTSYLYTISTQKMNCAKWWNTSIAYHYLGTIIRPVRHEEKPSQEKLRDMKRCCLGKFLVDLTFVTRRLHIWKAGREPSGERWNYLSRRQSCNLALMTAFTPFM